MSAPHFVSRKNPTIEAIAKAVLGINLIVPYATFVRTDTAIVAWSPTADVRAWSIDMLTMETTRLATPAPNADYAVEHVADHQRAIVVCRTDYTIVMPARTMMIHVPEIDREILTVALDAMLADGCPVSVLIEYLDNAPACSIWAAVINQKHNAARLAESAAIAA